MKLLFITLSMFTLLSVGAVVAAADTSQISLEQLHSKAEQGSATAQFYLGVMYDYGEGVPQDYTEAVKWYTKAAEQGIAEAQWNLGEMYNNGEGVSQDFNEAVKWYCKAAEQKLSKAQSKLGFYYTEGRGVLQNYTEAVKWYRKAAEQGETSAQFNLGQMYRFGDAVPQDYKESVKWYTKAAEQGLAQAQYFLSVAYANGQGAIEDYIEAYKWMLLAGENGYDVAEYKNWLKDGMTVSQIAEAQNRAKEFLEWKETEKTNDAASSADNASRQFSVFGTGFFVSGNGYFITAAHVVKDASSVRVFWESNDYTAEKVFVDETLDVAVLKVLGIQSVKPLSLLSSSTVQAGDTTFTLGFPQIQLQGIEPKYTDGSISSLSGMGSDPRYFQISVPVQPGNSGGPLLNSQGQVVGLITSRLDDINALLETGAIPQNVNYALKSSFIHPLLESLPDVKLEKSSTQEKAEAIQKAKNAIGLVVCIK